MKMTRFQMKAWVPVSALLIGVFLITACNSTKKKWVKHSDKSGAQLWSENCMRCHNFRSPASQSDEAWDVSVHHMRERGYLTAVEHEKILAFLKASN